MDVHFVSYGDWDAGRRRDIVVSYPVVQTGDCFDTSMERDSPLIYILGEKAIHLENLMGTANDWFGYHVLWQRILSSKEGFFKGGQEGRVIFKSI